MKRTIKFDFVAIPTEVLESLGEFTEAELKVIIFIFAKTHGWGKAEDWISKSQFVVGTGLSEKSVDRAMRRLSSDGHVTVTRRTPVGESARYVKKGETVPFYRWVFADKSSDGTDVTPRNLSVEPPAILPPTIDIDTIERVDADASILPGMGGNNKEEEDVELVRTWAERRGIDVNARYGGERAFDFGKHRKIARLVLKLAAARGADWRQALEKFLAWPVMKWPVTAHELVELADSKTFSVMADGAGEAGKAAGLARRARAGVKTDGAAIARLGRMLEEGEISTDEWGAAVEHLGVKE